MTRYKYDSAIERAYARAHRAEHKASSARSAAMSDPRNAAKHLRAARYWRVVARLYMKTKRYDAARAHENAKNAIALALFHDGYAKKIRRGEMGAPGSFHEMRQRVRGHGRDRRRCARHPRRRR